MLTATLQGSDRLTGVFMRGKLPVFWSSNERIMTWPNTIINQGTYLHQFSYKVCVYSRKEKEKIEKIIQEPMDRCELDTLGRSCKQSDTPNPTNELHHLLTPKNRMSSLIPIFSWIKRSFTVEVSFQRKVTKKEKNLSSCCVRLREHALVVPDASLRYTLPPSS